MPSNSTTARGLFGGAISCEIPAEFIDVSSFRQVPDNQEVFANANTDQCVIIELLQHEPTVPNNESGRFFFNEIARSNACAPEDVTIFHEEVLAHSEQPRIDQPPQQQPAIKSIAVGDQRVAKFKEGAHAKNTVCVYLANIRLASMETDVVISVSVPLQINPNSSSSHESFVLANSEERGAALFKQVLQSFVIHDWSLFG